MKKLLSTIINGIIEIRYNLFRSSLSLVGVVLGVMNLTTMFSIVEGAKLANQSIMDSLGTPDMISISLDRRKMSSAKDRKHFSLSWDDVEYIRKYCFSVKSVGVEMSMRDNVLYESKTKNYQIIGVIAPTFVMNKYEMEYGRPITDFDNEEAYKVCVIGSDVVNEFFPNTDPIGKKIRFKDEYFTVVGVIKMFGAQLTNNGGFNFLSWKNERILIPMKTMQNYFTGFRSWFSIYVQSKSIDMVPKTIAEVRNVLMRYHNNQDVFQIQSMQEWQVDSEQSSKIWEVLLGVVAGISLLVGGIGIMNVMLASFTERMREIGIRKAIGATNLDIFMLFLVETVVICAVGGIIGLAGGYIISMSAVNQMLSKAMNTSMSFSMEYGLVAVSFSLIIGLISGLYPAFKASRLAPVEALRYE